MFRSARTEEVEEVSVIVGQRVEGEFNGVWFPGTVVGVGVGEDDCTMIQIEYEDDDKETTHFPNSRIRFMTALPHAKTPTPSKPKAPASRQGPLCKQAENDWVSSWSSVSGADDHCVH